MISQDMLIDVYQIVLWIFMATHQRPTNCGFSRSYKAVKVRVILFSIHSDEWKSFQSQHQTALRGSDTLSWKPYQGGSDDGVTTSLQLSRNSRPPMLDHQYKCMMKAQVHVSKSFAISDIQALPQRKLHCQIYQVVKHILRGRLLASFQDLEHEGDDTRIARRNKAPSFKKELAKMMASEYVMASDPYNIQKKKEMSELLKIKNQELELKAVELEIRCMEGRQRDEALYETTTDEAFKERLMQSLFG
nr:hypothetical protein [Tanacetum cinerariifolium]